MELMRSCGQRIVIFGVAVPVPVLAYVDNCPTLCIANNPILHERTEHIEADCCFMREKG